MGVGGGVGQGGPQAIRTRYSGILFRSRLEARWAVFFDALGAKWEYEKEGYELPSGRYLPDFWLPDWGWVEIKGQEPTGQEVCLTWDLQRVTGSRVIILVGPPGDLPELWASYGGFQADGDVDYLPCVCPHCRRFGFEYSGRGARVCGHKCAAGQQAKAEAAARKIELPVFGPFVESPPGSGYGRAPIIGTRFVDAECCGDKGYSYDAPEILRAISTVRSHRFWDPQKAA